MHSHNTTRILIYFHLIMSALLLLLLYMTCFNLHVWLLILRASPGSEE